MTSPGGTLYNIDMSKLSEISLQDITEALKAIERSERVGVEVAIARGYGAVCKECGHTSLPTLRLVDLRTGRTFPSHALPGILSAGCPRRWMGGERRLGRPKGKGLEQGDELALLCDVCRMRRKRGDRLDVTRARAAGEVPRAPVYDDVDETDGSSRESDRKHLTYLP